MSLDEQGFLSEQIADYRQRIRAQHAAYFDLITRVNALCQETKYRLQVNNHNPQEMLATGIMIKLLNDVQGAVLLLEHGLAPQARILLRTALEALFILKNICEHANFWRVFIIASERDRLKLQRAIQANSSSWFDEIRPYITQELIDQLATEVATAAISSQTIAVLAQLVHLGHLYDGIYRLFSQEVHTSARALEQYMVFDEGTGLLKGFSWGPETGNISAELTVSIDLLLDCFGLLDQLFSLNLRDKISSLRAELMALNE